MRVLIYLLMALAIVILITADKPWEHAEKIAELKAKGSKLELRHHVATGLFYGSLLNLGLGAAVLSMRRFWGRNIASEKEPAVNTNNAIISPRVFWIGIGVAVLIAGGLRWNLANGSLWWDELWNIKHTMSGEFRPDKKKNDKLKFREVSWEKSIYYYRKPTNHPPMALSSRLSLEAWREFTGNKGTEFNELATRMPAILAGLLSVVGIALLLRGWGFGTGGLVAALLLAIHPWHIRYGIEARAYSFTVLWTVLGCIWLSGIFRSGGRSWKYWILFGLNQLLLVWSLPNGVYYAFGFGVTALAFCFLKKCGEERRTAMARVVSVNVMAAMGFIFLFLPNALQFLEWGEVNDHHYLNGTVLQNVGSQLAFGLQNSWGSPSVENAGLASFSLSMSNRPVLGWLALLCCGTAFLFGTRVLLRGRLEKKLLFGGILLGASICLLTTWGMHQHFYHRYVVSYLIAPFLGVMGIGCTSLARSVGLKQSWGAFVPALVLLVVYWGFTTDQRRLLNERSYEPFREVSEYIEDAESKSDTPIKVIGYGLGGRVFRVYYPECVFAPTLEDLDRELVTAKKRKEQVYVVHGYREFNRIDAKSAAGAAKLDKEELFEEVKAWGGIEPLFHFVVLRQR